MSIDYTKPKVQHVAATAVEYFVEIKPLPTPVIDADFSEIEKRLMAQMAETFDIGEEMLRGSPTGRSTSRTTPAYDVSPSGRIRRSIIKTDGLT